MSSEANSNSTTTANTTAHDVRRGSNNHANRSQATTTARLKLFGEASLTEHQAGVAAARQQVRITISTHATAPQYSAPLTSTI